MDQDDSMSTHWSYCGCDEAVKNFLRVYWEKKWPRLEKLLADYSPDVQRIALTVHCHERNNGQAQYELRASIQLPTGTLASAVTENNPQVAIDRVADTLVTELRRHRAHVRKDHTYKRKTRRREDLSAAGPRLAQTVQQGEQQPFFEVLRPHLHFLQEHAARELAILEIEGGLSRGEVIVGDLIDEVVVRAWEGFATRPPRLPLDLWLVDLLHQAIADLVNQGPRPHESLHQKVDYVLPAEQPDVADHEWWIAITGALEVTTLDEKIATSDGHEAERRAEAREDKQAILRMLRDLPPKQRQAFLLSALDDYELDEIALAQDRPITEVRSDIEQARRTLRERFDSREAVLSITAPEPR
jgi:RNA polymerase sigma factor (sigma-70 family)